MAAKKKTTKRKTTKEEQQVANSNGSSIPKILGLFMIVAVCLLGTYSSQTMTLQSERLDNMRADIADQYGEIHELTAENTRLRELLATFCGRFKEVETQFDALREYTTLWMDNKKTQLDFLEKEIGEHIKEYSQLHAVVKEKVHNLERKVFKETEQ